MRFLLLGLIIALVMVAFVPTDVASAQNEECIIDLMLVFDGSGSIPPNDFAVMKVFIQQLVNAFEIGPDASRIGIIQFSDSPELYVTLSDDAELINAAIDNMTQFGDFTNLARAIRLATEQFTEPRGSVPQAMILLTDGLHNLEGDPIEEAEIARDAGIEIFGVAVGDFDTSELMAIADAEENLIQVGSFAGLSAIADNLLSSACGVSVETVALPTPIPATATPMTAIRTPVPTLAESPTSEVTVPTGIVFASDDDGDGVGDREIFVIDPESSDLQQLTENDVDDNYPAWSPDGSQIAWVSAQNIWVMNADGSSSLQLTSVAAEYLDPAWSPDGTQIAYVINGDIWLMDSDGGNAQALIQNADALDRAPSFSPDGASLAYMSDVSGGRELYVYNLGDGGQIRLTDNGVYDGLPDWQSNGPMIAFASVRAPESGGEFEIYVTDSSMGNADQVNARQVTVNLVADDDPAWSPDGESIVYQTFTDGSWDLWIIDVASDTSRALIGGPANETSPDW